MASSDVWSDYDQIRHSVRMNTVDKLKHIISGLNEECGLQLAKSGKKQDIIDRIVNILENWRVTRMEDLYSKARHVISQVRTKGFYISSRSTNNPTMHTSHPYNQVVKPPAYSNNPNAGPSLLPRYDPYAPPRRPSNPTAPVSASSYGLRTSIQFKESPFYTITQAVSPVVECPESTGPSDRRTAMFNFTLSSEQITRLTASGSKTQLRLFCTSSVFYANNNNYATSNVPCPIEFPPTCEVRINGVQLTANLKGLKKKPGTAPPPNIGQLTRTTSLPNKVDMVYINTLNQQGTPPKKYYLIVMLVETTNVTELVNELKSSRYHSCEDIRQKVIESKSDDDDVVAGPQKMSLKCPLSFVRISTPARSSKCVHSQCFDATSWYSVMEQTTTWLCPVCEKLLDCKDLIVDGYFDDILKVTPDSIEDVIVEPDGEWHTSDNKFASAGWKTLHAVKSKPPPIPQKSIKSEEGVPITPTKLGIDLKKPKPNGVEVVILDTDDEDEGRVKRELSPSHASSPASQSYRSVPRTNTETSTSQQSDVIDLTADSDDERPPTLTGKRKAADIDAPSGSPTEQIWKKGRFDPDRALAAAVLSPPSSQVNGSEHHQSAPLPPRPQTHSNNQAHPLPYPAAYPVTTLPPLYPPYQGRGGSSNAGPQLPPIPSQYLFNRPPSSSSRWP
ncbi:hypothetical protein AMATHDRAFT_51930 [Amanita thiersii Skay4041]|uniref:SP-RING-type domain-containing protein n=1 Tax=Amanita thiersii Skay4041 TaxID=703135 RepID=A0A2A9P1C6_9AGAR|nr:hypothetical protein AMATHDRAFT_51930 [Amanita thiersii Skay4041]